ncbi:MAG: MFS transporter [Dehalococcoidia bacterium]|jgi:MFS family permease|nr:MFS transporter [Dehalococcoidia bacterium]
MPGNKGPFYGWWIVLATFLCNVITFGCAFYSFSLFVTPLQQDLGWGRGDVMAGFSLYFLVSGFVSPQVGRLVDRYGARVVMTAGAVILGIGFLVLSLMSSLWQFSLGYALVGLGSACAGQVPTSTVVSNWFVRRRGTAVGLMASGVGGGGLVLAPIAGAYLLPTFGWNQSYLVLGILCWAVIIPLAVLVIRTRPEEKGLAAYGADSGGARTSGPTRPRQGVTLRMAAGTVTFWLIVVTYLLSQFAQVGTIQNQVPFFEEAGFPIAVTAGALGAVGLGSALTKFGFGWLCDRMQARYALAIGLLLQIASIIILMNVKADSPASMAWAYAVAMGLGIGSWLPTMSMLVSSYYGMGNYGAIFGAVTIPYAVGSAIGPLAAGRMYDAAGNYDGVFVLFLVFLIVSVATILAARRPATR